MFSILSITNTVLGMPPWQGDGPYGGTSSFLSNFFFNGIGFWFYLLLLALAALIWVYYDSSSKNLDAASWRIGAVIAVGLLIPSIFFKFSIQEYQVEEYYNLQNQIKYLEAYQEPDDWRHRVDDLRAQMRSYPPLAGALEPIMYMGLVGGLGGVILAIAYTVTFQGATAKSGAGSGPGMYPQGAPPPPPQPRTQRRQSRQKPSSPPPQLKPKAHAWLVSQDGRSYQLNQGSTTIGTSVKNDIAIDKDTTVSRGHAKVVEQNNHFRLHDLGSTNGTRVNKKTVREPILLAANDQIQLGDDTLFTFVTSQ